VARAACRRSGAGLSTSLRRHPQSGRARPSAGRDGARSANAPHRCRPPSPIRAVPRGDRGAPRPAAARARRLDHQQAVSGGWAVAGPPAGDRAARPRGADAAPAGPRRSRARRAVGDAHRRDRRPPPWRAPAPGRPAGPPPGPGGAAGKQPRVRRGEPDAPTAGADLAVRRSPCPSGARPCRRRGPHEPARRGPHDDRGCRAAPDLRAGGAGRGAGRAAPTKDGRRPRGTRRGRRRGALGGGGMGPSARTAQSATRPAVERGRTPAGRRLIGVADAWWDVGLVWEIDSREWHLLPEDHDRDTRRQSRFAAEGIPVVHTRPSRLLREPAEVLDELARAHAKAALAPPPDVTTEVWRA
jgi:hypothetical protein